MKTVFKLGKLLAAGLLMLSVRGAYAAELSAGSWNVTLTIPMDTANLPQVVTFNGKGEYAGGLTATFNVDKPFSCTAYCVDIGSNLYVNWDSVNKQWYYSAATYTIVKPAGAPPVPPDITEEKWGKVSWIYQKYGVGQVVNTDAANAAQIAIWKVLYPDAHFVMSNSLSQLVTNITDANMTQNFDSYYMERLYSTSGQSLITGPKPSPVGPLGGALTPEASSLAMLLPGLLPLGLVLNRRKQ